MTPREERYTYGQIRRGLERFFSVKDAASRNEAALILYLDLVRAIGALPGGMRDRVWGVLVMDGQARMASVYAHDLMKGPIRRMQRFLNDGIADRRRSLPKTAR